MQGSAPRRQPSSWQVLAATRASTRRGRRGRRAEFGSFRSRFFKGHGEWSVEGIDEVLQRDDGVGATGLGEPFEQRAEACSACVIDVSRETSTA
jgi:hypothetical protein